MRSFTTFSADLFDGSILEKDTVPSVSFCGGITHRVKAEALDKKFIEEENRFGATL